MAPLYPIVIYTTTTERGKIETYGLLKIMIVWDPFTVNAEPVYLVNCKRSYIFVLRYLYAWSALETRPALTVNRSL